jgi:uncharacterized protein with GYD domain
MAGVEQEGESTVTRHGDTAMATYLTTIRFTEKGIGAVKDTCKRSAAFNREVAKMKVKVKNVYWTLGAFDGVIVFDAPNESVATAAMLKLASRGNVQTSTSRAFEAAEMEKIVGML